MIDLLPNQTILFQWLIFVLVFLILNWGIFKPALRILQERGVKTSGEKERAKHLNSETDTLLVSCEKKVEEGKGFGGRKREEILSAASARVDEILKKCRSEVDRALEETRQKIEIQSREASLKMKQYTRDLAKEMAVKVLEREF